LQWLQNPSEINGDNLNNVRRGRYFRNKKREYLKDKINEQSWSLMDLEQLVERQLAKETKDL
jgi:hypothetical protein